MTSIEMVRPRGQGRGATSATTEDVETLLPASEPPAGARTGNAAPVAVARGNGVGLFERLGDAGDILVGRLGAGEPHLLPGHEGTVDYVAVSPDGRWLYFVSDRGGSPQVYRMPAGGGGADRVSFTGNYNISPSVSQP